MEDFTPMKCILLGTLIVIFLLYLLEGGFEKTYTINGQTYKVKENNLVIPYLK